MRKSTATAALVAAFASTGPARAQALGGFSLDRFDPAPAGDPFFSVPSPGTSGHLALRGALLFDDAERPIRLDYNNAAVVGRQAFTRLNASLSLWNRLLLAVDAPIAVIQDSERSTRPDVQFQELDAPAFGDLRFGARVRVLGEDADLLQIGAGASVFAPTGSPEQYTGEGTTRAAFHVSAGGRVEARVGVLWGASSGLALGSDTSPARVLFGAGGALLLAADHLQVGPEIYGSVPLTRSVVLAGVPPQRDVTEAHLEAVLGVKLRLLGGLTFGAAAGPGLFHAVGTPTMRLIGLIGWTPLPSAPPTSGKSTGNPSGDADDDGIADTIDACPKVKGEPSADPSKDGCPPSDRDGDSVVDAEDACPTASGLTSVEPTKNGCPPDADNDGVPDGKDACPDVPGVKQGEPSRLGCPLDADGDAIADADDACPAARGPADPDPKQNGCPEDADSDGILRADDACPTERGPRSNEPDKNGCPRFVRVVADEIVTSRPVRFTTYGRTRSQTVDSVSDELLGEVRDVLLQHPEIQTLEVQGHTDDVGEEEFNIALSQERANAVIEWLVAVGVPRDKLVAKGYGFRRPAGDNRVRTGREENRRVQFFIIRRKAR